MQTAEVNGLYRLVLGRAPDAVGGAAAVAYLKAGGSLTSLAAGLFYSVERETTVVGSYYRTYLRREGSAAEVAGWVKAMQVGLADTRVAAAFLDSTEYNALFAADATFVQALYGDILGRRPSTDEVANVLAVMAGGLSRAGVVAAIVGSFESDIRIVSGLYGVIYGRNVDSRQAAPTLFAEFPGVYAVVSPDDLAVTFLSNAEFIVRANATVR